MPLERFLTGDKLPIIRNAVSVESNRKAILLEFPPEEFSVVRKKNGNKLDKLNIYNRGQNMLRL